MEHKVLVSPTVLKWCIPPC